MNKTPKITIDLVKLSGNCRVIKKAADRCDVRITGVIKGTAGDSEVAACLVDSGLSEIGDSRLENLAALHAGKGIRRILLRVPSVSRIRETAANSECGLNSEINVLEELNRVASGYEVMLMVDMGDLREGFQEERIWEVGEACRNLKNIRVTGIGTNFSCFAGAVPTLPKLERLVQLAEMLRDHFGLPVYQVSGGNSSSLPFLFDEALPPGINHLRIGEGILLGKETLNGTVLPGMAHDAFVLEAEIIQAQMKPAAPDGPIGRDAFGRTPQMPFLPEGYRYLLNIGHQDTPLAGLIPLDPELTVLGGSSDYMVVAGPPKYKLGDKMHFHPNYWSLLALMTSRYVYKEYRQ